MKIVILLKYVNLCDENKKNIKITNEKNLNHNINNCIENNENNAEKSCDNSEYIEKLKRIRINNCFVDAKKECLNTFIKNYTEND